jgi:predicted DNA-binding protein (MmcQ/YjbR family)
LNKRHWITVTLNADVPDDMVRELIEDSYDLVATSAPRT